VVFEVLFIFFNFHRFLFSSAFFCCNVRRLQTSGSTEKSSNNRCSFLTFAPSGFQCRCGGLFCSVHRYSDKHGCTFDYKEHGAELIRKHNPMIVGEKLQKI